jgi:hypothetical protein
MDDLAPHALQIKKDKRFSLMIFVSGRLQTGQTTKLSMYRCNNLSKLSRRNFP